MQPSAALYAIRALSTAQASGRPPKSVRGADASDVATSKDSHLPLRAAGMGEGCGGCERAPRRCEALRRAKGGPADSFCCL